MSCHTVLRDVWLSVAPQYVTARTQPRRLSIGCVGEFLLRNVDAKHTSVSALPVIPLRISTANDIVSVHQPATGEKNV